MALIYHIRVKKEYATSVIEDLQKMEAIEILTDDNETEISQWQMDLVNQRIKKYKDNSALLIEEDPAFKILDAE
ncbi:hypothetical protein [Dyadobacter diqingensis]|uniref:hypothetical protein n=1 Tax=Dyadobacter diqingensis TaxID=2938121 RepID=UPI0020C1AC85|nr:hypothetical protein [Dyadobacter diqingensis]